MTSINDIPPNTASTAALDQARLKPAATAAPQNSKSVTATQDSATLSGASATLSAGNDSDVRMDKVASIKASIDNGSYSVSSSDVAGRLIDSMLRR